MARSERLRQFSRATPLTDICRDLIGPDVRLYFDQAVYKRPNTPSAALPFHQDNGYNFKRPEAYITIWIPLHDVDADGGCLWVVPGVHRRGTLQHHMTDDGFFVCDVDHDDAHPVPVAATDLVVLSSLTPHATGGNHSARMRKAYLLSYVRRRHQPSGLLALLRTRHAIRSAARRSRVPRRPGRLRAAQGVDRSGVTSPDRHSAGGDSGRVAKRTRTSMMCACAATGRSTGIGFPSVSRPSAAPKRDRVVTLRDGRRVGFAEWGPTDGRPVVLFHGMPGSRLSCPDEEETERAGVRLITIDRPGYGVSSPHPGRTLLGWVSDYVEWAELVGLPPCPIVGWSGGGPYALACAVQRPECVTAVGLAASPAPLDEVPSEWDGLAAEVRDLIRLLRRDPPAAMEGINARCEWLATGWETHVRTWLGLVRRCVARRA